MTITHPARIRTLTLTALLLPLLSHGAVLISSFDNFTLGGTFGKWSDVNASFTSGPTGFTVDTSAIASSPGAFGGGFYNITPNVGNPGLWFINLDLTVNALSSGSLTANVILQDADGTQNRYQWQGLGLGNHLLSRNFFDIEAIVAPGTVPGLDATDISWFQIHAYNSITSASYSITFNELSMAAMPEPSSLGLLGLGLLVVRSACRRRMRSV